MAVAKVAAYLGLWDYGIPRTVIAAALLGVPRTVAVDEKSQKHLLPSEFALPLFQYPDRSSSDHGNNSCGCADKHRVQAADVWE